MQVELRGEMLSDKACRKKGIKANPFPALVSLHCLLTPYGKVSKPGCFFCSAGIHVSRSHIKSSLPHFIFFFPFASPLEKSLVKANDL